MGWCPLYGIPEWARTALSFIPFVSDRHSWPRASQRPFVMVNSRWTAFIQCFFYSIEPSKSLKPHLLMSRVQLCIGPSNQIVSWLRVMLEDTLTGGQETRFLLLIHPSVSATAAPCSVPDQSRSALMWGAHGWFFFSFPFNDPLRMTDHRRWARNCKGSYWAQHTLSLIALWVPEICLEVW